MQLQLNVGRKAATTLLILYEFCVTNAPGLGKKNALAEVKCINAAHIKHKKMNPEPQPWVTNIIESKGTPGLQCCQLFP